MEQALIAAKQLLMGLNDIQPAVSTRGIVDVETTIQDLKRKAGMLIEALTPLHPRLESVVEARREDMNASFKGLIDTIPFETPRDEISDQQIASIGVAAEVFAIRCSDYIKSSEELNRIKSNHITGVCDAN